MTKEERVIVAVTKNRDIHHIMGEETELFGEFGDVFDWVRSYYIKHKETPSLDSVVENFPDIEVGDIDGPTKYYVEDLKSTFVKNRMNRLMLAASARIKEQPAAVVLAEMQSEIAKINKFTAASNDLNLTDYDAAVTHFQKVRELSDAHGGTPGISTGFAALDASYPTGFAAGHSIICMGYTGRGKSLFMDLLAVKAWQQGYKPMIMSLEMSPEEQRERIYSIMGNGKFRISQFSRGDVQDDRFIAWSEENFRDKNDFIVVSNEGTQEVTPNIVQAKIDTHKPDIVFLDYLQLMSDNGKTQAMTPRMLNLSREIKLMAVSNNIPIVSITAVTDNENDKRDGPPTLDQVAWSRGIEYDANLALSIHKYDDSNQIGIACRKNRHGDLFYMDFEVDIDQGIWHEV